jgi:hypothetical protein
MRYLLAITLVFCVSVPAFAATVTVSWKDNSTNEQFFDVERKAEACTGTVSAWSVIASPVANTVSYVDSGPFVEGQDYCYRVAARNTAGKSPYSNTAGITLPFTVPNAPSQTGVVVAP